MKRPNPEAAQEAQALVHVIKQKFALMDTQVAHILGTHRRSITWWKTGLHAPQPYTLRLLREATQWTDAEIKKLLGMTKAQVREYLGLDKRREE